MNKKTLETLTIEDFQETLVLLNSDIFPDTISNKHNIIINYQSLSRILDLCLSLNYIKINDKYIYSLTEKGESLTKNDTNLAYLELMYDVVYNLKPEWARKLKRGRTEAVLRLPENIVSVFEEINLYKHNSNNYSSHAIKWWDKIANAFYAEKGVKNTITGRIGEKLSLYYETLRLKNKYPEFPSHEAIKSDKCGYDILSKISKSNNENLCIEVKASRSFEDFYLTENEIDLLNTKNNKNYQLHYWDITKLEIPKLFIINKDTLNLTLLKENIYSKPVTVRIKRDILKMTSVKSTGLNLKPNQLKELSDLSVD